MSRKFERNILIICEGENTEPTYFGSIKSISLEQKCWDYIDIFPRPKEIEEDSHDDIPKIRKKRQKRKLKQTQKKVSERNVAPADEEEIQYATIKEGKETWPTPVRYIKEARDRIKKGTYMEIWAVFDKDGHPAIESAIQLAQKPINGQVVNIAFSSIAFEHWVLLHFEKNNTDFPKSADIIDYIKHQKYISDYAKDRTFNIYPHIQNKTEIALENAAWLHHKNSKRSPYWGINPYTGVDKLILCLFCEAPHFLWVDVNEIARLPKLIVELKLEEEYTLFLTNTSERAILKNNISLIKLPSEEKTDLEGTQILIPNEKSSFSLSTLPQTQTLILSFENTTLYINITD